MCGIIGINSNQAVAKDILAGLVRLEYRGYDSAGIAVMDNSNNTLQRRRAAGKLAELHKCYAASPIDGNVGIGHTRWATHGLPTENNAHPHGTAQIAVVHNGIIENFPTLKAELGDIDWQSETDTEVIVHLFLQLWQQLQDTTATMQAILAKLEGAFALAILLQDQDNLLLVARRGSPMAVAQNVGATMAGSDAMALSGLAEQICYLRNGEWAILEKQRIRLFDPHGQQITPEWHVMPTSADNLGKGNYPHAMLREIHEQPSVIGDTLNSFIDPKRLSIIGSIPDDTLYQRTSMLQFCACGTAYYATLVAGYWFENLCQLPVRHEIASELRYRGVCALPDALGIFVSQSGETMDTMEALHHWQNLGRKACAIVNVPESSLARAADHTLYTLAGPEIGVASTKAFTTQLTALYCEALSMAKSRGLIDNDTIQQRVCALLELPGKIAQALEQQALYQQIARDILAHAEGVFFLGRGNLSPIAMEGALKLKEITYMHAEGYAAGEMKHGPIALVSKTLPVVFLAPQNALLGKTLSNMNEIIVRGGKVIMVTDAKGLQVAQDSGMHHNITPIVLPETTTDLQPILHTIPMQMLAYETAHILGREIDQPRNLAKSVTVE